MAAKTLTEILLQHAARQPDHPAILSLEHAPLTYRSLIKQIECTSEDLNRLGITQHERLALVMPNGPEMALAFLATSSATACAPLNPNYRETEFAFYLSDLKTSAILTLDGFETPAIAAARLLDLPILRWQSGEGWPSFHIILDKEELPHPRQNERLQEDDIALLLHTSGTTSRPKLVPLTRSNLVASAENISRTLCLTCDDLCLNIMPLFHIHGLLACLCASLLSGGCVACSPGFYAPQFFDWLEHFQPTWYSAVPTMHQSILEQSEKRLDTPGKVKLRFLRSSSAPLPPKVLQKLEQVFNAPMIEAYGMTEATHQIASNPLPPARRKAGSVGLPAGAEITLLSEEGNTLSQTDLQGEIGLRGPGITSGYLDNPEANRKSFRNGWFLTGDLGYFDADGYLHITGRSKEIINRGGEKISPREIDEALLEHPAVAQAMAFAFPDDKLGENVAAAVVLKEPGITERDLRRFLNEKLSAFKIPSRIVLLNEIPKGPTGKPQRIGMAEKLGITGEQASSNQPFEAPRTVNEVRLAALWCEVLKLDQVSIHRPFLELGGDSMTAMQLANRICEMTGKMLPLIDFFEAQTIEEQAILLDKITSNEVSEAASESGATQ